MRYFNSTYSENKTLATMNLRKQVSQKITSIPRKTNKSPSKNYVPPASIKTQNDDKTINININIIN